MDLKSPGPIETEDKALALCSPTGQQTWTIGFTCDHRWGKNHCIHVQPRLLSYAFPRLFHKIQSIVSLDFMRTKFSLLHQLDQRAQTFGFSEDVCVNISL